MKRIFVWGAGRCGRSIAAALHAAGHRIVGTWNRTAVGAHAAGQLPWPTYFGARPDAVDDAEVVWITVSDAEVEAASRIVLRPDHIAFHAAGALAADRLRAHAEPRSVAACHPLQSFSRPMSPPTHLRGVAFGLQGEPEAVAVARGLVADMGAWSFVVDDEAGKTLYHAACCVASNALVALCDRAVSLFAAGGVSRDDAFRALLPLIRGTVHNLEKASEPGDALTGPIARGDAAVVDAHIRAISEHAPDDLESYRMVQSEVEALVYRNRSPIKR